MPIPCDKSYAVDSFSERWELILLRSAKSDRNFQCMLQFKFLALTPNLHQLLDSDILPVQLNPSPVYPGRQVHFTPPGMFLHVAREAHPPLFFAHSSTSASSQMCVSN